MDKFIGKVKEIIRKCSKVIKTPFNAIGSSVMSKDEALKILNIKECNVTVEKIINQSKEYIQANDPIKGGSFYIQNKIYHARETLLRLYQPDKSSKHNTYTNSTHTQSGGKTSMLKEEIDKLNRKH